MTLKPGAAEKREKLLSGKKKQDTPICAIPIESKEDHIAAVGARLRQLIDALDIPYVEAARDMGVPKSQLGNWMRGDRSYPPIYPIYRFCRIRGVDMNWVFLADPSGLPHRVTSRLLRTELNRTGGGSSDHRGK